MITLIGDVKNLQTTFVCIKSTFWLLMLQGLFSEVVQTGSGPHTASFGIFPDRQAKQQRGANHRLLMTGAAVWQPTAPRFS